MAADTTKTRGVDITLEFDAPPDMVWKALTDASEVTKWFCTDAQIELRPGGRWEMAWQGLWKWEMEVTDLQPGRRVRLVDRAARPFDANGQPTDGTPVELVLEYIVEARQGGGTTLRLVHSGFGHGDAWDDEVDGVSEGWNTELRVMRHYLARPRGERRLIWPRALSSASLVDVWRRWVSPTGFITSPVPAALAVGSRLTCALATGDTISGTVLYARMGRGFLMSAEQYNSGVFRFFLDRAAGKTMISVILNAWDIPEADATALESRLTEVMDKLT